MRKFNPKNFFLSILHLAIGTNHNGYDTALMKAWKNCSQGLKQAPRRSSLSEYREKISFQFFKDFWEKDLQTELNICRRKLRGFYVYAIDGDDFDLPASEDIIANGYRGYPIGKDKETHYPKMYTVQALDIVNGIVKDFSFSTEKHEVQMARQMAKKLETKSIAIYDRLHSGYLTAKGHVDAENYFLIRIKDQAPKNNIEIKKFCQSKGKKSKWIDLTPGTPLQNKEPDLPSLRTRLVKIKNPRTKKMIVFMTNLKEEQFLDDELGILYQRRWEVETNFRDLTSTALKMNQWHSKKLNGILQEIYATLWLVNQVRIQVRIKIKNWLNHRYEKANFKHCVQLVCENLDLLVAGKNRKLKKLLNYWIWRTTEARTRLSRSYPRQAKRFGKKYTNASTVKRRP